MRRLFACLMPLLCVTQAAAQTAPPTPVQPTQAALFLEARARELVDILRGSGDYATFFTIAFQTEVPKGRFAPVNVQLTAAYGAPVALDRVLPQSPFAGTVRIRYEKATVAFQMAVDPADPHQVSGLRVLGPIAAESSIGEVTRALQGLHGTTAYAFAKVGADTLELIAQHNADKPLAVGSAFKLVILAELVRATNAGQKTWDDLITLDGRLLPAGGYNTKPRGTKVTVRELATKMISVSDNSATDILLASLGRNTVEAMLPVLGVSADPRNIPFLSTLEAFKLKWLEGGRLADRYNALDDTKQRALLAGDVLTADITPIMSMTAPPPTPSRIDSIEWFYSPLDLVRVMDWLRRNTEGVRGADARAILSRNAGLSIDRTQYAFVGFKGGSEPGVINLTLLLQGTNREWYVATASWNDPTRSIDEFRFVELVTALVKFAGAP